MTLRQVPRIVWDRLRQGFRDRPRSEVAEADRARAERALVGDAVATQAMGALAGGPFLVAYALALGASDLAVGILAALGPLMQFVQLPAGLWLTRVPGTKRVVLWATLFARASWLWVALVPWVLPPAFRVPALLALVAVFHGFGTVGALGFSSWVRNLLPEERLGRVMGRRLGISTAVAACAGLAAGFAVDLARTAVGEGPALSGTLVLAGAFGLASLWFLAEVPEPQAELGAPSSAWRALADPFRDARFRRVVAFTALWGFAANLGAPFFAVYLYRSLGWGVGLVVAASVVSQLVNVAFYPLWGALADRFSNRAVLAVAVPAYLLVYLLWPFTTLPDPHPFSLPLVFALHALAGVATAGTNLCVGNLVLKAAPRGRAPTFLAANALVSGAVAATAPVLAGWAGNRLAGEAIDVEIRWASRLLDAQGVVLTASFRNLDFLFLGSALVGIAALWALRRVEEAGTVDEAEVLEALRTRVFHAVRHVSTVAGLRDLFSFPYALYVRLRPNHRVR
ncbi:MFS transporter [Deferrisoma palaeochoriense]